MKKIKILIVEDEAIIALHLKNLVLRLGDYECASVGSGEDAVEISETMNPDVVFMDINLKGSIDGIEAARQICREKYIPIVFVSAYSDEETIETAKQVNPAGYLTKPIHAHVLQRTLESLLKENFEEEVIETYEVQDVSTKEYGGILETPIMALPHSFFTPKNECGSSLPEYRRVG